jgi:serine/threonine protein kinase
VVDLIGHQFGDYLQLRLIGQGGLTTVYVGQHIRLSTIASVKIFRVHLTDSDMKKFHAGLRILAQLEHPHFVRLLDIGEQNGIPFLVTTYAPNGNLREKIPEGEQVPPLSIAPYVKQIASALQYAHHQRLIHQNLKPENMLLGQTNEVLLDDFYFPLMSQISNFVNTQEMVNTTGYMAPEQLQGNPLPASDQYSL